MATSSIDLGLRGLHNVEVIGSGGSAIVYRAVREVPGRFAMEEVVAVKVLRSSWDTTARRRFEREQRVMDRLSETAGFVPIRETGETGDGSPYIVMPYYEGGSLQQRIARNGPLDWPRAVRLVEQVAQTLVEAHELDVFHRDIKPANILLSESGRPHVADFGISLIADDAASRAASTATFTPAYSPPESFTDGLLPVAATDIYGLAATLWAVLAGHAPFKEPGERPAPVTVFGRVAMQQVGDLRDRVPSPICRFIERSMAKRPENRPPTMADFLVELQEAREDAYRGVEAERLEPDRLVIGGSSEDSEMIDLTEDESASRVLVGELSFEAARGDQADREARPCDRRSDLDVIDDNADDDGSMVGKFDREDSMADYADPDSADDGSGAGIEDWADSLESSEEDGFVLPVVRDAEPAAATSGGRRIEPSWKPQNRQVAVDEHGAELIGFTDDDDWRTESRWLGKVLLAAVVTLLMLIAVWWFWGPRNDATSNEGDSALVVADGESAASSRVRGVDDNGPSQKAGDGEGGGADGALDPDRLDADGADIQDGEQPDSAAPSSLPFSDQLTARGSAAVAPGPRPTTSTTPNPLASSTTSPNATSTASTDDLLADGPGATPVDGDTGTDATTSTTTALSSTTTAQTTSTTAQTTITTTGPSSSPIAIVTSPYVVSITGTSLVFAYRTNDVCGTGSFEFTNLATGASTGRWIGDRGCFGPLHYGESRWPGVTLEPNTRYLVTITVEGQPGNGSLPTGTGQTSTSFQVTTPGS